MRIGEIVKKYRDEHRLSVRAFADKSGISRSYLSQLENDIENKRSLTLPKIGQLARAMEMTPDDLIEIMDDTRIDLRPEADTKPTLPPFKNILPIPPMKDIQIIGTIPCGEPVTAQRDWEETVQIPECIAADFALRADGESMIGAGIESGSLVFCKACEIVDNGQIAAVVIDDEATLKRFYDYGAVVVLKPDNPEFQDLVFQKEEINAVRIIGRAVSVLNKVK